MNPMFVIRPLSSSRARQHWEQRHWNWKENSVSWCDCIVLCYDCIFFHTAAVFCFMLRLYSVSCCDRFSWCGCIIFHAV